MLTSAYENVESENEALMEEIGALDEQIDEFEGITETLVSENNMLKAT